MEQRLLPGVEVEHAGQRWRVHRPLGPDAVLLCNEAGETVCADPVRVSTPAASLIGAPERSVDEARYTEAQWAEAARRRDIIMALHRLPTRTRASVDAAAAAIGINLNPAVEPSRHR